MLLGLSIFSPHFSCFCSLTLSLPSRLFTNQFIRSSLLSLISFRQQIIDQTQTTDSRYTHTLPFSLSYSLINTTRTHADLGPRKHAALSLFSLLTNERSIDRSINLGKSERKKHCSATEKKLTGMLHHAESGRERLAYGINQLLSPSGSSG